MNVKQIIVIRKDLGMRRGKEIAQGAHASMEWLRKRLLEEITTGGSLWEDKGPAMDVVGFTDAERTWLNGDFKKVVCQVPSEHDLIVLREQVLLVPGLEVHTITDHGLTEFHGNPTLTALAIGPDIDERIDPLTRHLKLY